LTNTFKYKYEELNTESDFSCRQINNRTLYALHVVFSLSTIKTRQNTKHKVNDHSDHAREN